MIRQFIFFVFFVVGIQVFAQKIETDIFDNLIYESSDRQYKANLKKNIFDDLVFSDNMDNEVTLKKKYLDLEYSERINASDTKSKLFMRLIHEHSQNKNYKVTYSVDIFDKVVIEDNRNRKVEIGKDIFYSGIYNELHNDVNKVESNTIIRNLNGGLEYKSMNDVATLQKDMFNKWKYSDSYGNELTISIETWRRLKNRFQTEEKIFQYFISEFLNSSWH